MDTQFAKLLFLILLTGTLSACAQTRESKPMTTNQDVSNTPGLEQAVFGAGCFWCVEAVFQRMEGVVAVESGYTNGHVKNPTYKEVCTGNTGHAEVIKLYFDPKVTSFAELLEVFWRTHDPTTLNRQGNDVGTQYRSGIYYLNDTQRDIAEKSKEAIQEAGVWDGKVVTEIVALENYSKAEDYHQNYYNTNPNQSYCYYVISPKVEKFKKLFGDKLKEGVK